MITDYPIELQRKPRGRIEFWAYRVGTRAQAIESARELLEDMREQGFTKAKVFINGKRIMIRRTCNATKL